MRVRSQRDDPGNKPRTHRAEGRVDTMAGLHGIRFRTVQPAASPYADYAIPADMLRSIFIRFSV